MKHRRPVGSLVAGFLESVFLGSAFRDQIVDEADQETDQVSDCRSDGHGKAREQHQVFKFRHNAHLRQDRKSSSSSAKSLSAEALPPRGSPSRIFCRLLSPQAMPRLPFELKA